MISFSETRHKVGVDAGGSLETRLGSCMWVGVSVDAIEEFGDEARELG